MVCTDHGSVVIESAFIRKGMEGKDLTDSGRVKVVDIEGERSKDMGEVGNEDENEKEKAES